MNINLRPVNLYKFSTKIHFYWIVLMIIFFEQLNKTYSAMTYPIHLGGFSGDTDLQLFSFDTAGNLVASGISSDTSLVSAPSTHIVMYLANGAINWAWQK